MPTTTANPHPICTLNVRVFSLKNHQKPELPQHMPATTLASFRANFFRLLSPSILQDLRACLRCDMARESALRHRLLACAARIKTIALRSSLALRAGMARRGYLRPAAARGRHESRLAAAGKWVGRAAPSKSPKAQKPPKSHDTATLDSHKRWHNPPERCVTLCHLVKRWIRANVLALESEFADSDGTSPGARVFYRGDSGRKCLF